MTYSDWLGTKVASPRNEQNAPNAITYWKKYTLTPGNDYGTGGLNQTWVMDYGIKKIDHIMITCNQPFAPEFTADGTIKLYSDGVELPDEARLGVISFNIWVFGTT